MWSISSVQFSHSVVSDSLQLHGLQHARPSCPSPTPGVYSNSCPLSQWCHPTISSCVIPFSSYLQSFPASGSFQMSQSLHLWPRYWSFSFNVSPSNEYSGLISFSIHWLDLLAVQGTLKCLLKGLIFFAAKDGEALFSQQKQDQDLGMAQIMNSLLPNSDLKWRK